MIPIYVSSRLEEVLAEHLISKNQYLPAYGVSAGLDLYYTGKEQLVFNSKMRAPNIHPIAHDSTDSIKLIPTGLHIALPVNHVGIICDRGSITKTPLVKRAGIIDPGYAGEIFVNLTSHPGESYKIEPGQKLPVQLVVVPFVNDYTVVDREHYEQLTMGSLRRDGKVGSSDRK